MRLYMQEKVFSWRDRFKVWDEEQNEKYYVEGELFSWGKRLHVYDAQGNGRARAAPVDDAGLRSCPSTTAPATQSTRTAIATPFFLKNFI